MSDARSELTVSLWRGAQQGRYQTYSVPLRENQTVLDVVTFVQRHLDPTLSYRFACRVGVCGSCAMTVNGRPRWTCRTHVSSVAEGGRLEIGPLENLPVIRIWPPTCVPSSRSGSRRRARSSRRRRATTPSSGSSLTARRASPPMPPSNASIAACAMPPAIPCAGIPTIRAGGAKSRLTLVNDARDAGNAERLAAVAASGGCHACHSHQSCQEHCPAGVNPTASIAGLKRRSMGAYLRGKIKI
jgi:fumarate reductase iron-sulfur subunit